MGKQKIEIKIQSKSEYYFDAIKKNIIKLFQLTTGVLILMGTIYIGFYVLLFFIFLIGVSYLLRIIKNK